MTLTTEQRRAIWEQVMRTADCLGGIAKSQLLDVVNALDDWWEATWAAAALQVPVVSALPSASTALAGLIYRLSTNNKTYWCVGTA